MASPFADYPTIVRHLETRLLVADLKDLLKDLHLSTSGNKRPLIDRVAAHLNLLRSSNDVARYISVKNKILRCGAPTSPSLAIPRAPASSVRPPFSNSSSNGANGISYNQFAGGNHFSGSGARPSTATQAPRQYQQQQQPQVLNFRPSPFYEVAERMSNVVTLPYASRNTVSITFVCSMVALDKVQEHNTKHKIALMCGESTYAYNPNRQLLMEFPNPTEVKVNNQKVQSNLRGMKNKPGTIPPPDITQLVSKTPRVPNRVDITYTCGAEVNKKYGAQVVLLRTHSVEELVDKVKNGIRLQKDRVLEKLRKPDDDDIEMASFDLTLKDPLSYMRITVPCRSFSCKHNQCWDAAAFLQINEQTPQWTCPICHIEISGLGSIAVDAYFQDILDNVGQDVDTILVDPQGNWRVPSDENEAKEVAAQAQEADRAYEILDLDDTEDEDAPMRAPSAIPNHLKSEAVSRSTTPIPGNGSNKRKPVPICIDLTEDSDEDEQSPKRIKQSHSMDNTAQLPNFSPKTTIQGPMDDTRPLREVIAETSTRPTSRSNGTSDNQQALNTSQSHGTGAASQDALLHLPFTPAGHHSPPNSHKLNSGQSDLPLSYPSDSNPVDHPSLRQAGLSNSISHSLNHIAEDDRDVHDEADRSKGQSSLEQAASLDDISAYTRQNNSRPTSSGNHIDQESPIVPQNPHTDTAGDIVDGRTDSFGHIQNDVNGHDGALAHSLDNEDVVSRTDSATNQNVALPPHLDWYDSRGASSEISPEPTFNNNEFSDSEVYSSYGMDDDEERGDFH